MGIGLGFLISTDNKAKRLELAALNKKILATQTRLDEMRRRLDHIRFVQWIPGTKVVDVRTGKLGSIVDSSGYHMFRELGSGAMTPIDAHDFGGESDWSYIERILDPADQNAIKKKEPRKRRVRK